MIATRRQLLARGGGLALAVIAGGALLTPSEAGSDTVFVYSQGLSGSRVVAEARAGIAGQAIERTISLLTPAGFGAGRTVFDLARNKDIVALLDNGDALIVEQLIRRDARDGEGRGRRMSISVVGPGAVLLTAMMSNTGGRV